MSKTQRVESLIYRLSPAEGIVYQDPPPLEVDHEIWKGLLENGVLTCHMKVDYGSVSDARKDVERDLRAWEIDAAIAGGRGSVIFVYQDAVIADLTPRGEKHASVHLTARGVLTMRDTAVLTIERRSYPRPPTGFAISPDVEALWTRYGAYVAGQERLLPMAHWFLTKVEAIYGQKNRQAAANTLKVDYGVLNTLGRLTSTRGDDREARKAPKQGEPQPLSGAERTWIEAVLKVLIRRAGEHAACGDSSALPKISVSDFPPQE